MLSLLPPQLQLLGCLSIVLSCLIFPVVALAIYSCSRRQLELSAQIVRNLWQSSCHGDDQPWEVALS